MKLKVNQAKNSNYSLQEARNKSFVIMQQPNEPHEQVNQLHQIEEKHLPTDCVCVYRLLPVQKTASSANTHTAISGINYDVTFN